MRTHGTIVCLEAFGTKEPDSVSTSQVYMILTVKNVSVAYDSLHEAGFERAQAHNAEDTRRRPRTRNENFWMKILRAFGPRQPGTWPGGPPQTTSAGGSHTTPTTAGTVRHAAAGTASTAGVREVWSCWRRCSALIPRSAPQLEPRDQLVGTGPARFCLTPRRAANGPTKRAAGVVLALSR